MLRRAHRHRTRRQRAHRRRRHQAPPRTRPPRRHRAPHRRRPPLRRQLRRQLRRAHRPQLRRIPRARRPRLRPMARPQRATRSASQRIFARSFSPAAATVTRPAACPTSPAQTQTPAIRSPCARPRKSWKCSRREKCPWGPAAAARLARAVACRCPTSSWSTIGWKQGRPSSAGLRRISTHGSPATENVTLHGAGDARSALPSAAQFAIILG